jgi:hypothetical protein
VIADESHAPVVTKRTAKGVMARYMPPPIPKSIKENGPVEDVSNTGDRRYLGTWIAEVTIAHPNGDLIRKYNVQQKRLEQVCIVQLFECLSAAFVVVCPFVSGCHVHGEVFL